jgi:hypothetical protein
MPSHPVVNTAVPRPAHTPEHCPQLLQGDKANGQCPIWQGHIGEPVITQYMHTVLADRLWWADVSIIHPGGKAVLRG